MIELSKTKYQAVVSGCISRNKEGMKTIEIHEAIHDDPQYEVFTDMSSTLMDAIETGDKKDHYFIAYMEAHIHFSDDEIYGQHWNIETEVKELSTLKDLAKLKFS